MRRLLLLALIPMVLAPLAPSFVSADECTDAAADQRTMDDCAEKAYRAADAELNTLYRQIERRLASDADTMKLLVATQRAWVGFRDAECRFAASGVSGGSAYPAIFAGCATGLTKKRIGDFRAFLTCAEGDMSCPAPAR